MTVFDTLKQVVGVDYASAQHNKDILDAYFLRLGRDADVRLPTGSEPERYNYHGAHVFTPTAGLNHHVVYVDLASLYPNLMRALNVGPDTIIGTDEDLAESEYSEDDCVWGYIDPRPVKHVRKAEDWRVHAHDQFKMVYERDTPTVKWVDEPRYERCYYVHPDVREGFIAEGTQRLLDMKYQYEGDLYEAVKRVVNCYTGDTEVLTPDGVVNIKELEVGDEVYSFDADTEHVEVKPVTETFAYPDYDGDIHRFNARDVDLAVTPNHKMVVQNANPCNSHDSYEFIEAADLSEGSAYKLPHDWEVEHGEPLETFDLTDHLDEYEVFVDSSVHGHTFAAELGWYPPRRQTENCTSGYRLTKEEFEANEQVVRDLAYDLYVHVESKQKWVPMTYDGKEALELLAWFVTEGSTYTSDSKEYGEVTRGVTHSFSIAQHEGEDHDRIAALLDSMGLTYYEDEQNFTVASEAWVRVLRDLCGDGSHQKQIPELVFDLDQQQKSLFFAVLMLGDGDRLEASSRYTTSSEQLRDDMMRLCVHLGRTPKYSRDSGSYRIYTSATGNSCRPRRCRDVVESEQGVYCVEVPDNHTLLAGRNGSFQFCGNSQYGYMGYATETNSSRLYDWRIAESVTLAGRKVIQYTARAVRDYLESEFGVPREETYVALGDTDGAGICWPDAPDRDTVLEMVQSACRELNETAYGTYMAEEFGVPEDRHHMEVEVESYASSAFVPAKDYDDPEGEGRKKRYAQHVSWDEGEEVDEVDVTGFEAVRSDTSPLTTKLQTWVLDQLTRHGTDARTDIFAVCKAVEQAVRDGIVPVEAVAKRGGIGQPLAEYGTSSRRPSPLYRGAKYADEYLGVDLSAGSKPFAVYLKTPEGLPRSTYLSETAENGDVVDAISVEHARDLPDNLDVAWTKHADKAITEPLRPILRTMGWSWAGIRDDSVQRGLEAFTS